MLTKQILLDARKELLEHMKERKREWTEGGHFATVQLLPPRWPLVWDINNGWCEEYANEIVERVSGAEAFWNDDFDNHEFSNGPYHCFVRWQNLYYDAECLDGVADWKDLPIFRTKGMTVRPYTKRCSDCRSLVWRCDGTWIDRTGGDGCENGIHQTA